VFAASAAEAPPLNPKPNAAKARRLTIVERSRYVRIAISIGFLQLRRARAGAANIIAAGLTKKIPHLGRRR
jgi:hypothetical protein